MPPKKKITPQEELEQLCDFSVQSCVAHVSEFTPGTEYFNKKDAETLLAHLAATPDLTGVIWDGQASPQRPGILDDSLVFYNRSEEEMLEHLKTTPRHEHVHWMFNRIMEIEDYWMGKFRADLPPPVKIVRFLDTANFHSMCERMLRVIVQSATVLAKASEGSLQERYRDLQRYLDGFGQLSKPNLQKKLHGLEDRRKKHAELNQKGQIKVIDNQIAEVKKDIELLDRIKKSELELKIYKTKGTERQVKNAERRIKYNKRARQAKEKGLLAALRELQIERQAIAGVRGKAKERAQLDKDIQECKKEIAIIRRKIENLEGKIETVAKYLREFGREPETSPIFQRRVTEHVRKMYERFEKLGEKHNIQVVTKPSVLAFGNMAIDYASDRGRTWNPMPSRTKRLAEAYHGLMEDYRENVKEVLQEMGAQATDIDIIMEGGNSGAFFARWQRLHLTDEEIRNQHVNTFYTGGSDGVKHVLFLAGMPCEPQDAIAKYANREKPGRTRGGKTMGSATHPVFIRAEKNSVSGFCMPRKHKHGIMSVEATMYHLLRTGEVLAPFKAVMSMDDSDNHFGSPEMDPLGTLGQLALQEELLKNPLELYGKKVPLAADFNLGDAAEANSNAWKEGHKFRREVMSSIKSMVKNLAGTDTDNYRSVLKMAVHYANDMMGGSQENMKLNQRVTAWVFKKRFLNLYHSPDRLRDQFVHVSGNHFDNASRASGHQEHDSFEDWLLALETLHEDFPELNLKAFSLKVMAGGEPQYFQKSEDSVETVVHLYGYSVARQGIIKKFGTRYDGQVITQKTYRVGLSHEPKNALNKARSQRADVHKDGHTHESFLTADKAGDNKGRFIDQKPTTQRVSPTELGIGGLPRMPGIDLCIYTQPQRYMKMTIPMDHMRRIGLAWLKMITAQEIKNKNKAILRKKKRKTSAARRKKVPTPRPKSKKGKRVSQKTHKPAQRRAKTKAKKPTKTKSRRRRNIRR